MARMIPRAALWGAAALLGLALAGALAIAEEAPSVTIDNFTFKPGAVTVAVGTELVWTNHDDIPHTVTSADDPRAFKSPPLDTGDSFRFRFTSPGTYKYFCSLHPKMVGSVTVK